MASNLEQFVVGIRGALGEAERRLTDLHRYIALEALRRIVQKTAVDTGQARNAWHLTIGVSAADVSPGGDPIGSAIATLTGLGPYQVVWITNNTPQATVLEFGLFVPPDPGPSKDPRPGRKGRVLVRGGFSVQTPQGMVRITIEELKTLVTA